MPLSLKNPLAEQLAEEIVRETGETKTKAVIIALQERLKRLAGQGRQRSVFDAIMEVSQRCTALPDQDRRTAAQILGYDEHGVFDGH
jgi:antitoxin VapB